MITQLYKSGVLFIISVSFLLTVYVAVSMVFSWLILIMFWSMTTLIRNIVFDLSSVFIIISDCFIHTVFLSSNTITHVFWLSGNANCV